MITLNILTKDININSEEKLNICKLMAIIKFKIESFNEMKLLLK